MTREEEVRSEAYNSKALSEYCFLPEEEGRAYIKGYVAGAEWADAHPKNPWRDAVKDPPKDGEWCLFRFADISWTHGLYGVGQMPNMAISDYIKHGEVIGWMPIPETPEGGEG